MKLIEQGKVTRLTGPITEQTISDNSQSSTLPSVSGGTKSTVVALMIQGNFS